MPTLLQELPEKIRRLEAKHGSGNPFVKQLKEQLRAMKENKDQSTQEVYRLQAAKFSPNNQPSAPAIEDLQNLSVDPALAPMQQTEAKSQESTMANEQDSRS
jgi:hypothetical protein